MENELYFKRKFIKKNGLLCFFINLYDVDFME